MYALNKNELRVFRAVCEGHESVAALKDATGLSSISIYRINRSLSSKKLLSSRRDGRIDVITRSPHGHSRALATFLEGNHRSIEPLVGSRLLVLLSVSSNPKTLERIAEETMLAPESVRKIIWALRGSAAITQNGNRVAIPHSDTTLVHFLQDFSKGASAAVLENIASTGAVLWSEGLQFVFTARNLDESVGARETGVTAMSRRGLQFVSDTRYYHYAHWRPSLKPEDVALHNILIDPNNSRGIAYSMLFLLKSGYRPGYLCRQGEAMGAGELSEQIVRFLNGESIDDPLFPSVSDMHELRAQYGVT